MHAKDNRNTNLNPFPGERKVLLTIWCHNIILEKMFEWLLKFLVISYLSNSPSISHHFLQYYPATTLIGSPVYNLQTFDWPDNSERHPVSHVARDGIYTVFNTLVMKFNHLTNTFCQNLLPVQSLISKIREPLLNRWLCHTLELSHLVLHRQALRSVG